MNTEISLGTGMATKIAPSNRLSYRLMTRNDKQDLFELDQDPDVMLHLNGGIPSLMAEVEDKWIPRMESYTTPERGWGLWHVSLTASGEFLGWILIRPMHYFTDNPNFRDLELGWRFFKRSWGKGFATEAAKHLMLEVSRLQVVDSFSAVALKANKASISVMKKLGMEFVKEELNSDPLFLQEPVVTYRIGDVQR